MDDYANLDYDRAERCGFPEVIYGASKTPEQICTIATQLLERHGVVMATRVGADAARIVQGHIPDARWFERSGLLFADRREHPVEGMTLGEVLACPNRARGSVIVACAGTSDIGIAEEAALTARIMGSRVRLLADIGVAGVHRTLAHEDDLREARVIVVVAGMEGALASLVAGLVDVPVIGVPTSVGYGASFGGLSALLSMLNSCAGGVSVVNIDNGFGPGRSRIASIARRAPFRPLGAGIVTAVGLQEFDDVLVGEPPFGKVAGVGSMRLGKLVAKPSQEDCRDRGENPGNARRVLDDVVNDQEIVRANGGEAYDDPTTSVRALRYSARLFAASRMTLGF